MDIGVKDSFVSPSNYMSLTNGFCKSDNRTCQIQFATQDSLSSSTPRLTRSLSTNSEYVSRKNVYEQQTRHSSGAMSHTSHYRRVPGTCGRWREDTILLPSCKAAPKRKACKGESTTIESLKDVLPFGVTYSSKVTPCLYSSLIPNRDTKKEESNGFRLFQTNVTSDLPNSPATDELDKNKGDNTVSSWLMCSPVSELLEQTLHQCEISYLQQQDSFLILNNNLQVQLELSGSGQGRHTSDNDVSNFTSARDVAIRINEGLKSRSVHGSLESLVKMKERNDTFPDFLSSSLGAPAMDKYSRNWGSALQRPPCLENLNLLDSATASMYGDFLGNRCTDEGRVSSNLSRLYEQYLQEHKSTHGTQQEHAHPEERNAESDCSVTKPKRQISSRVEELLGNDLFKKHLSNHIDIADKKVLQQFKKLCLKKSASSWDLSEHPQRLSRLQYSQTLHNHNSREDICKTESGGKLYLTEKDRTTSTGKSLPQSGNAADPTMVQKGRRKSITGGCGDASHLPLTEMLRGSCSFPRGLLEMATRRKIQIPSFDEFRKQQRTHKEHGNLVQALADIDPPAEQGSASSHTTLETLPAGSALDAFVDTRAVGAEEVTMETKFLKSTLVTITLPGNRPCKLEKAQRDVSPLDLDTAEVIVHTDLDRDYSHSNDFGTCSKIVAQSAAAPAPSDAVQASEDQRHSGFKLIPDFQTKDGVTSMTTSSTSGLQNFSEHKDSKPTASVLRSSSDVTHMASEGHDFLRKQRLKKARPYKSDPLSGSEPAAYMRGATFETGFERELVSHLSETRKGSESESDLHPSSSFPSSEEFTEDTESEIMSCIHCNPAYFRFQEDSDNGGLCEKCVMRQQERKDTIHEIIDTEVNYGRDLRIMKEEFLQPMQTTGLLTAEQLETIFINLEELIAINNQFTDKLNAALQKASNTGDEELTSVNIGSVFLESSSMFLAFENYCINQASATSSLEQLERERELLRIFLQVSQTENGLLRRMHLKSFLMVPVQRVMKYPLLLSRLYKATPSQHADKEEIRRAREKIEEILNLINAKAKSTGSLHAKRKQSDLRRYSLTEKIEINRVALEVLGWKKKEVTDLITSRMWYAQATDHTWASKRCRNVKFAPVHAVLFTLEKGHHDHISDTDRPLRSSHANQAAVVLVREKNGKFQAVRDPFLLDKSVVSVDPDFDEVFEVQEWGREAYIFKAEDPRETRIWLQHLRQQTHNLGQWRRRRNALPNIMLKHV